MADALTPVQQAALVQAGANPYSPNTQEYKQFEMQIIAAHPEYRSTLQSMGAGELANVYGEPGNPYVYSSSNWATYNQQYASWRASRASAEGSALASQIAPTLGPSETIGRLNPGANQSVSSSDPSKYVNPVTGASTYGAPSANVTAQQALQSQLGGRSGGGGGSAAPSQGLSQAQINAINQLNFAMGLAREGGLGSYATPEISKVSYQTPSGSQTYNLPSYQDLKASQNSPFKTYYVPAGDRAVTELLDTRAAYDPKSGEVAYYQVPINPYTGLPRTGIYGEEAGGMLIGGGSRASLQSGMFSQGVAGTPDIRTQYDPSRYSERADVALAEAIRANPEKYSRLGAEAYFGIVQPLDSRTIQSTGVKYGRFPAFTGNLANLVDPQGANLGKAEYPGADIPLSIPLSSPNLMVVGLEGIVGASPQQAYSREESMAYAGDLWGVGSRAGNLNPYAPQDTLIIGQESGDESNPFARYGPSIVVIPTDFKAVYPSKYDTPLKPSPVISMDNTTATNTTEDRYPTVMVQAPDMSMQPDYMVPYGNVSAVSGRLRGSGKVASVATTVPTGLPTPYISKTAAPLTPGEKQAKQRSEFITSGAISVIDFATFGIFDLGKYTTKTDPSLEQFRRENESLKKTATPEDYNKFLQKSYESGVLTKPVTSGTFIENPALTYKYGEYTKAGQELGEIFRSKLNITPGQLDVAQYNIEQKKGVITPLPTTAYEIATYNPFSQVTEKVVYGTGATLLTNPEKIATAYVGGAALVFGGEAIGFGAEATGITARATTLAAQYPTAAAVSSAATRYGVPTALAGTTAYGATEGLTATPERTQVNIGKMYPEFAGVIAGGTNAYVVSRLSVGVPFIGAEVPPRQKITITEKEGNVLGFARDISKDADQAWRYPTKPLTVSPEPYAIIEGTRYNVADIMAEVSKPREYVSQSWEKLPGVRQTLAGEELGSVSQSVGTGLIELEKTAKTDAYIFGSRGLPLEFVGKSSRTLQNPIVPPTMQKYKDIGGGSRMIRIDNPVTGLSVYEYDVPPVPMDVLPGVGKIGGLIRMESPMSAPTSAERFGITIEPATPKGLETRISGAAPSTRMIEQLINPEIRGGAQTTYTSKSMDTLIKQMETQSRISPAIEMAEQQRVLPSATKKTFATEAIKPSTIEDMLGAIEEKRSTAFPGKLPKGMQMDYLRDALKMRTEPTIQASRAAVQMASTETALSSPYAIQQPSTTNGRTIVAGVSSTQSTQVQPSVKTQPQLQPILNIGATQAGLTSVSRQVSTQELRSVPEYPYVPSPSIPSTPVPTRYVSPTSPPTPKIPTPEPPVPERPYVPYTSTPEVPVPGTPVFPFVFVPKLPEIYGGGGAGTSRRRNRKFMETFNIGLDISTFGPGAYNPFGGKSGGAAKRSPARKKSLKRVGKKGGKK